MTDYFAAGLPLPQELTTSDIAAEESRLLRRIDNAAKYLANEVEDRRSEIDRYSDDTLVVDIAFAKAAELTEDSALDYLYLEAQKACVATKEFNYIPFIDRLIEAIYYNKNNILIIQFDKSLNMAAIAVDFSVLGTVEEYISAANEVRNNLGFGKTGDPAQRSIFWREKIYGVDREGKRITKTKKGRGKDAKETTVDITDRYLGKYYNTINARLALIPSNKAPFWELIEYGNASLSEGKGGGTPYPSFPPTYMRSTAEQAIANFFDSAYNRFYNEAYEQYKKIIDDLKQSFYDDMEGTSYKFYDVGDDIESWSKDFFDQYEEKKQVVVDYKKEGDIIIERRVSKRGKEYFQAREKGRFIKLPTRKL